MTVPVGLLFLSCCREQLLTSCPGIRVGEAEVLDSTLYPRVGIGEFSSRAATARMSAVTDKRRDDKAGCHDFETKVFADDQQPPTRHAGHDFKMGTEKAHRAVEPCGGEGSR